MRNMTLLLVLSMLISLPSFAGKAALVKLIKGEAVVIVDGKEVKLKANDWIDGGAVVKTSEKSFVKLVFIDKSQMNVGPLSEIKIEKFQSKDAGIIDLVKGKIRSQVTKDYLQIQGKDRSKLFIKTKNAVMGIRGTDFMITTNGHNTAAILFEGEVVFNRLNDRGIVNSADLDRIVDQGVRMFPGEFSAVGDQGAPTVPALLNVGQRDRLEKNVQFDKNESSKSASAKSIVPAGLSGTAVASKPNIETVKSDDTKVRASVNADGFVKDGQIKPANGSFVHLDSATIIAPGKDAVLDENSNTYIASDKAGSVSADGSYNPPKGVSIAEDGKIQIRGEDGKLAIKEIAPNSVPITSVNQSPGIQAQDRDTQIASIIHDVKEANKEQTGNASDTNPTTGIVNSTTTGGTSGASSSNPTGSEGVSGGATTGVSSSGPTGGYSGGTSGGSASTDPATLPQTVPPQSATQGGSGGGGLLNGLGNVLGNIIK
jgi:hypothetical protein